MRNSASLKEAEGKGRALKEKGSDPVFLFSQKKNPNRRAVEKYPKICYNFNMKDGKTSTKNKAIFWDYDPEKADFTNPKIALWRMNRKLRFGDFSNIKKTDLKKYFSKLDINSSLKELLKNYLRKYV